jgi:hypothetical protein
MFLVREAGHGDVSLNTAADPMEMTYASFLCRGGKKIDFPAGRFLPNTCVAMV